MQIYENLIIFALIVFNDLNDMYNEIKKLLHYHNMNEALEKLTEFASSTDNWQIKSEIENLKTTYGYMIQYAAQGVNDPERKDMYNKLYRDALILNDKTKIQHMLENEDSYVSRKYKYTRNNSWSKYSEICINLETIQKDIYAAESYEEPNKTELIQTMIKKRQITLEKLFDQTWIPLTWNNEDYDGALSIIESNLISDNIKALLASAICLSSIYLLDPYKLRLLIFMYMNCKNPVVSQRALAGIMISIFIQNESIENSYPTLFHEIGLMKENPNFFDDFYAIIIQVILSLDTENIEKKMRDEIIPSIMKSSEIMEPIDDVSEINIDDLIEKNPQWRESIEKINDQIKELDMLRQEGADTNMTTFSQLKKYPFFYEPSHWFYIFSEEIPDVFDMAINQNNNFSSFIKTLEKATDMCDSDKFSLLITFKSMPNLPIEAMNSGLSMQNKINDETVGINIEKNRRHIESRHFIQDLYRFCKLWGYKNDKIDIFSEGISLWKNVWIRNIVKENGKLKQLADYLFAKEHIMDAMFSYMDILDDNPTDYEAFQKVGYANILEKNYASAIKSLSIANILNPGNIWTLKNLAQCYKKTRRYDLALECLKEAENINPDDISICNLIGQTLISDSIYDEALRYMFKVEYMTKGRTSAQRAIAWCYFMTERNDEAINMYNKILQKKDAKAEDWMNMGHVYIVNNDIKNAVSYYKKANEMLDKKSSFYEIFSSDIDMLQKKGVEKEIIFMIPDMVTL